jgi:hypothetical protein
MEALVWGFLGVFLISIFGVLWLCRKAMLLNRVLEVGIRIWSLAFTLRLAPGSELPGTSQGAELPSSTGRRGRRF